MVNETNKGDKVIKQVDNDIWNRFVALAKLKDMRVGKLFEEIIFVVLEKEKIVSKKQK